MTDFLLSTLKSALAATDSAFSRTFQVLWMQILSEHRRHARRRRHTTGLVYFS